jgi:hypothetical protein
VAVLQQHWLRSEYRPEAKQLAGLTGAAADIDRNDGDEAQTRTNTFARPAAGKHKLNVALVRAAPASSPDEVRSINKAVGR